MATINIPNLEHTVGIPAQSSDVIPAGAGELFLSMHPAALPYEYLFAANQTIDENTVVGFNANKEIVPAVDGTVQAIGVSVIKVVTGAAPLKGAPVYRTGHFNHKRLNWHASYNTEAKKIMAFEGAPTPTQIRIGTPKTYTP